MMTQQQTMGAELVVDRARLYRAWGFLVLMLAVLSACPSVVSGQLRRGDTSKPVVQVGALGAATQEAGLVGDPNARMRGVEPARSTDDPSNEEALKSGGGLRSQHTGPAVNVQAGITANVQPGSPAKTQSGSPDNAPTQDVRSSGVLRNGRPTAQSALPPAVPVQQMRDTGMTQQQQIPYAAGSQPVPMQQNRQMRGPGSTPHQQTLPPGGSPAVAMHQNGQQMRGTGMNQEQQLRPLAGQPVRTQQDGQQMRGTGTARQQHTELASPPPAVPTLQNGQQMRGTGVVPQQEIPPAALPPAAAPQQKMRNAGGSDVAPQQQQQQQQHQYQHQQRQQQHHHEHRQQRREWHRAGAASDEDAHPTHAEIAGKPTGMEGGAVVLTDETFASFVKSEPFALVLFYAPWCHWSRATLPEFDAVARFMAKVASRPIVLGKVNCDENPNTQKSQHILEYPIIKLYIDGKPKQYVGGRRRTQIFSWLNHNLQRDERLDTIPHLDEFMRNGQEGHQLVVAVTTRDNADGSGGGDSVLFDHATFRHVARSFSDEVLFGEIHETFVFQRFLNQYVLPRSKTTVEMWRPPFIVAATLDPADPPFVKYLGRGDDRKELERFVHKYRFPQVQAFEPDTIEDIFDDGRSICLLLLDGERAAKSLTREGLVDPVVAAFHDVAGEYREDLIFTISGNKEAHERRIFNLLGVDETITAPVMRIATFNPSGNGKYYPAQKYKPTRTFTPGHNGVDHNNGTGKEVIGQSDDRKAAYSFRNRSPTHSLIVNALTTSAKTHNSLRSSGGGAKGPHGNPHGRHAETTFDAHQRQEQAAAAQVIRDFAKAFLEGQLEPYTNSEPIPPAAQNAGPVKTFVGLSFQAEVIDAPNDVFITFGAPWCGHCRKLEPAFKRVAEVVTKHSSLVMGKIDATLNELDGINLSGYPTLLLFRAGSKQQPIMYDGDRSESDMLIWLARNAQHSKLNLKKLQEELRNVLTGSRGTESRRANTSVLEEL